MLLKKEVTARGAGSRVVCGFLILPKVLPKDLEQMERRDRGDAATLKWRWLTRTRMVELRRLAEGREYWIDGHWLD